MTPIRERLQAALTEALRSRDALRMSVLRTTLSAIGNAEAVDAPSDTTATEVPRRHLSEDDVRAVELERKAAVLADALAQPSN